MVSLLGTTVSCYCNLSFRALDKLCLVVHFDSRELETSRTNLLTSTGHVCIALISYPTSYVNFNLLLRNKLHYI